MPFMISVLDNTVINCEEAKSLLKCFMPTHGLLAMASKGFEPRKIL